ncbi:hypothetical protein HmCmsJML044_04188 [Escherichia coli]|nr:hypothetical protein HmCmsJML044_04188 [Escherichia coli]
MRLISSSVPAENDGSGKNSAIAGSTGRSNFLIFIFCPYGVVRETDIPPAPLPDERDGEGSLPDPL